MFIGKIAGDKQSKRLILAAWVNISWPISATKPHLRANRFSFDRKFHK
jgi:hypothetical protein